METNYSDLLYELIESLLVEHFGAISSDTAEHKTKHLFAEISALLKDSGCRLELNLENITADNQQRCIKLSKSFRDLAETF